MYLGDIEVFRTSTAEPTADGIIWTYLKVSPEMTFDPDRRQSAKKEMTGHDALRRTLAE